MCLYLVGVVDADLFSFLGQLQRWLSATYSKYSCNPPFTHVDYVLDRSDA